MEKGRLLYMQGVTKTFPGVTALDDVNFDLRIGEVHGLLGENGAGKSTLVKILSGAYQPTRGRVVVDGVEVKFRSPRQSHAMGITVIYQELNLVPHLTAGENIFLGREPMLTRGVIDNRGLHAEAQDILDQLNARVDARLRVSQLGVAQRQMVEIARALSVEARILIMDEPTSALSEVEIEELFATIRALKSQGVSIVYISHRLEELLSIGDRVTVLRDGKVTGVSDIASVSPSELIRLMVNRELRDRYPRRRPERGRPILRVSGLSRKGVLNDVSFILHAGEVLGIVGLMGSGRTELTRVIFGADRLDRGTVEVHGKRAGIGSPHDAVRHGIGLLPENRKEQGLILSLSVQRNICLASEDRLSRWGIVRENEERRTAEQYIDHLSIKTPGIKQKVVFLSGGNQQKVVMAKWLCSMSDILIFDEPTRGIDVASKVEVYKWMNRLTDEGVGILMVSSDISEILGMSDRILVMHEGAVVGEFTPENATQEKILHCALGATG